MFITYASMWKLCNLIKSPGGEDDVGHCRFPSIYAVWRWRSFFSLAENVCLKLLFMFLFCNKIARFKNTLDVVVIYAHPWEKNGGAMWHPGFYGFSSLPRWFHLILSFHLPKDFRLSYSFYQENDFGSIAPPTPSGSAVERRWRNRFRCHWLQYTEGLSSYLSKGCQRIQMSISFKYYLN